MKILPIVMVASALVLASANSSADPVVQKDMVKAQVSQSVDMQMPSDNRTNSLSERRIYKKTVDASRQVGSATEGSRNANIQKASKDITNQLKKEVDEKTPEEFIALIKRMESDSKFSFDLTQAIGTQDKEEANSLLMKATGSKMSVDYIDINSEILTLKLCASINGVRRCFPSQRPGKGRIKCPTF